MILVPTVEFRVLLGPPIPLLEFRQRREWPEVEPLHYDGVLRRSVLVTLVRLLRRLPALLGEEEVKVVQPGGR